MGELLGFDYVELEKAQPRSDVLQKLPASAVYQYNVLPLRFADGVLTVVASDPFSTVARDGLRLAAGCPVTIALAPREEIDKAVKKFYGVGADAIEKMIEDGRYAVDDEDGSISKIDVGAEGKRRASSSSSTASSPRPTARARRTSTSSRRRRSSGSATASTACSTRWMCRRS